MVKPIPPSRRIRKTALVTIILWLTPWMPIGATTTAATAAIDRRALAPWYHGPTTAKPPIWGRVPITATGTVTLEDQGMVNWAILHEFGHSWLASSVSTDVQTSFLHLRGLETWNDLGQPWYKRGFEHAAEIIAGALTDQEVLMYRIRPTDFDSLQAGFQVLTGRQEAQRLQEQAAP